MKDFLGIQISLGDIVVPICSINSANNYGIVSQINKTKICVNSIPDEGDSLFYDGKKVVIITETYKTHFKEKYDLLMQNTFFKKPTKEAKIKYYGAIYHIDRKTFLVVSSGNGNSGRKSLYGFNSSPVFFALHNRFSLTPYQSPRFSISCITDNPIYNDIKDGGVIPISEWKKEYYKSFKQACIEASKKSYCAEYNTFY